MSETKKYILYCAQEANFQTRSMLIPYDDIMRCGSRVKDLETLRSHASKDVTFEHRGKTYTVDQLLIQNITWDGKFGTQDQMPFTKIINDLHLYAEGSYDSCIEPYDSKWLPNVICGVASEGFNNVINYCNFRNKTVYENKPIEIVEGFLVLESNNGKVRMPSVDTVDEMLRKYYSK